VATEHYSSQVGLGLTCKHWTKLENIYQGRSSGSHGLDISAKENKCFITLTDLEIIKIFIFANDNYGK